jgi:histone deacetylase 1/2
VITGSSEQAIDKFKKEMKGQFQMSDLGLLSFYLGIEVHQEGGHITVSQAQYAAQVVKIGEMEGCHPVHTPMEERLPLSRDSTAPKVNSTEYRRLVVSLRYLLHTLLKRPTEEHMKAVKRILRYINGTSTTVCARRSRPKQLGWLATATETIPATSTTARAPAATFSTLGSAQ